MKKFYSRLLSVCILIVLGINANAQNCTVNAGINQNLCPGQPFVLQGTATGSFAVDGAPEWTQISGPAVILGTPQISGNTINVPITGYSLGNTYVFRMTAKCQDGTTVFQNVTFMTLVATVANAGGDILGCPGTQQLSANAAAPGENGAWSYQTGPYGINLSNPSSPTSNVNLSNYEAGVSTLRWTITNPNGCTSFDDITVTNRAGVSPVYAGPDQTLSNCYTISQNTYLSGMSYGGNGTGGQQGVWTFINGPSTPLMYDYGYYLYTSDLVEGTYRFRWTVSGPCVNGYDEVDVIVPAATQDVTSPYGYNSTQTFCTPTTDAVLNGPVPSYTNETSAWTHYLGFPANGTITSPLSSSTTVTGLNPNQPIAYYIYTITNSVTGCSLQGYYSIQFTTSPTITTPNPVIVRPCDASDVSIPYSYTGGDQTMWALVSAPANSIIGGQYGFNNYQYPNGEPQNFTGLDKIGSYVFRFKRTTVNNGQGGCEDAFIDITVVISQSPTAANAGTNQFLNCNSTVTSMAGNTPTIGTGSWSQVSGPNPVTIVTPSSPTSQITGLSNGAYVMRWLVTGNSGCPSNQSDVTISVATLQPTQAVAGADQLNMCYASPIQLSGNTPILNETGVWTAVPSSGISFSPSANSPNAVANGLAASTSYYFIWQINNGCGVAKDTTVVTTTSFPGAQQALAGADACVTSATIYTMVGNQPAVNETGLWSFISGPAIPSITSPSSYNTGITGLTSNGTYIFVWSLSKSGCSSTYDTVKITKSPSSPIALAGLDQAQCGTTTITLAGNTPGVGTGVWSQVAGPGGATITTPGQPNTTVTGLTPGNYTFRWTISNGACSSSFDEMVANISTSPSSANAGADQFLCSTTSTTLAGNTVTSGTGLWAVISGPNTPSFSNSSSPTTTIFNLVTGTYVLRWTINTGSFCPPSSDTVEISVTQQAFANTPNATLCAATAIPLNGNSGSTGTWTNVSGPNTPVITTNTPNTAIASGLIPGTYVFNYAIAAVGSCPATSDDITVVIYAEPEEAHAGTDQAVCLLPAQTTVPVTLGATPPTTGSGFWTLYSGPTNPPYSPNSASPTATLNLSAGTYFYRWNITNGSCNSNYDIVRIDVYAPPSNANAGLDQTNACAGSITMAGNTPAVGLGTWTQMSGPNISTIDAPNNPGTSILNTITGAYQFQWTISNGGMCPDKKDTVLINVTGVMASVANAGVSQQICNNPGPTTSVTLAANPPAVGETGSWILVSGPNTPLFTDASVNNTVISNMIQGNYILRWTLTQGSCSSTDTMIVSVTDAPTPSNAGTPQSACLYSPVTMAATPATTGTGLWTVNTTPIGAPTPVFITPNAANTQVTGLLEGVYVFTWTTSNGLCPSSTSNVTITVNPAPTQAIAGVPQTGCAGQAATMAGNNPISGTGIWSVVSGPNTPTFTNANLYNTTVTGLVAGTYVLQWSIATGGGTCTSNDNTQITVQPSLAANTIAAPQTICNNTAPATLTGSTPTGGSGTYVYQWQFSTTSGTTGFTNVGGNSINHSPSALTATRWYRRYVTSGGCSVADTSAAIEITVLPLLAANTLTAPTPATFCGSGDASLIVGSTPTGGDGSYTYQWQSSTDGTTYGNISGATSISYDPPVASDTVWYRRIVTTFTCAPNTSAAVQIIVVPYSVLTSHVVDSVCNNALYTYTPSSTITGTTYSWSRAAVPGISNSAAVGTAGISETLINTTTSPINVVYSYTLTANGCTNPATFNVVVKVKPSPNVNVPANSSVCDGALAGPFSFTSAVVGTTFAWTNNTPSIGLGVNGTGDIAAFTATNASVAPVTATITVTPSGIGCAGTPSAFTVTVNPTPALTSATTASTCSGNPFAYAPTATPTGATISWTRTAVAGVSNGTSSGSGAINETLINTTGLPVNVTYVYTISANGCNTIANLVVTVNPSPVLTSSLTPGAICDNTVFSYLPTSNVPSGVTFSWSRAAVAGIVNGATSGAGNPNETLDNNTTQPVAVTYVYTLSTVGCTNPATYNVVVMVNPTPGLTSTLTPPAICNSTIFTYNATSNTVGTTYSWTRAAISSINGNVGGSGAGAFIGEVLTNNSVDPVNVTYAITLSINGCTSIENVVVSVNPTPLLTSAASIPDICSGTTASYGPTSSTVGTIFNWSRAAVTGISTTAANGTGDPDEVLVNTTSAPITVTYVYSLSINGCVSSTPYNVTVVVKPTPILSSPQTAGPICSGTPFAYTPTSPTTGTTFAWSRATVLGISNLAASGTAGINETLINTTSAPINVTYVYTLTANGCVSIPYNVVVTINPIPSLTNAGAAPAICSNNTFSFVPASLVTGSTFNWTRAAVVGISNAATSGTGNPNEVLVNITNAPVTVTYVYIVSAGGCNSAPANVTVVVNPTPALTSTLTPADICSNTIFNYPATSNIVGATISWSRALVAGISNVAATGNDNPNETLINTTGAPVVVTYVYTVSANGCNSIPYNVTVTVKPSPVLSTTLTPAAICSNTPFSYSPASTTGGTVFNWSRALVAGISNGAATGSGNPMETLVNTTTAPVTVTYVYTLTANGCTNVQNVAVVVNPTPVLSTPLTIAAICNNGTANYVAASSTTGATFSWTRAANPSINGGVGGGAGSNTISEVLTNSTNFPVTVSYVFTITANGCNNTQTVTVQVNPSVNLTSTLAPPAICDNAIFSYVPASNVTGATFAWSRATVVNIANAAASGTGNPNETLDNTGTAPVAVTYIYTATANGCTSTPGNVVVMVNPTPVLSSVLSAPAICSGTNFSYTPTSATTGTVFNWSRAAVTGISNTSATGLGNPNEVLTNTTAAPVTVTYVYSLSANGCTNPVTYNVTVTVNPTPILTSTQIPPAICNNTNFSYTPTSSTTGATFAWSRAFVTGINNLAATGTDNPNEVLVNNTNSLLNVVYIYTVSANGCNSIPYSVTVTVNPTVNLTSTPTPPAICNNTVFNYTPASNVTGATFAWSRAAILGISNPPTTGTGNPAEQLVNTTVAPITVTYVYTVTAYGCSSTPTNVTVVVQPAPSLTSTQAPPAICSNTTFNYTPTSGTTGTAFAWSRGLVAGIANAPATGNGNPAETLVNTTNNPVNVTYVYTLSANGCTNPTTYNVVVTVNPTPVLTSTITPPAICDNATFSYVPTSNVMGATFGWTRAAVSGVANGAAVGTGNPNEALDNTSAAPVAVTYVYTVTANGCVSTFFNVTVMVNPSPVLTSTITPPSICNATTFSYVPTSGTTGTVFNWSRAAVTGIANTSAAGTGNPNEVLTNTTANPVNVTYVYSLSANGCTNLTTYNVVVTVNPSPILTSTLAPVAICSGSTFSYTPTSTTTGAAFAWSRAVVPGITNVAATGIGDPAEALFNNTNAAINVTYVYTVSINGCSSPAYSVVVSVKPQPALTSITNPSPICNNTTFNYTPTSNVTGTTFAWTRAAVAGISNPASSGINNPAEMLSNTSAVPVTVTYIYTLTANGCVSAPINVAVVVNPTPALTSTLTPPTICSGSTFNYTPTSATPGTIFNWARAAVAGISNTASSGAGNPAEALVNTTAAPINVAYVYTLSANSCTNPVTYSVVVTVSPNPTLSSSLTPAAICNNTAFSYVPTSTTIGATFAWSRASVIGISNGAATGTNNPNETLINTTAAPVNVTYVYTLSANGCTNSTTYNVVVTVKPTPVMTSPLTMPAICGNTTFNYSPTSSTSGAAFAWSRASVPGIANASATGVGNPSEILINNTTAPVTVTYVYTVSANGCSNPTNYNVTVVVSPVPVMTSTVSPPAICNNATFNYTPTSNTTGTTFAWSRAAVAGITNTAASGTGNPAEALTNTTPNPINVTYVYTLSANGCTNTNTYSVVVTVNPTPLMTSTLTPPAICHNSPFIYMPTSLTPGTTFAWTRAAVSGINGNTSGSGFGNPNEMLANSTNAPITVNYVYTLSANGCTNPTTYTVSVVVNPLPILTSTLNPADMCDSTVFNYIPTSPTVGTVFTWSRAAVAGIANAMATGTGNPAETLYNTTPIPVDVTYVYVLSINGCNNPITYNVVVTVNPTPLLSTPLNLASQCNNLTFAYTPASPTPGTTFSWSRAAITGIANAPATGSNGINEVLENNSPDSVQVVYEYSLTANGCTHTQLVAVWVKPTPLLTSPLDAGSVCNNTTFSYTPTSLTVGTAFAWTRAAVNNISNPAASGTGDPNEVLVNTGTDTVHVTYTYTLSAYGCTNPTTYAVVVVVNPDAQLTSTLTPSAICDSTVFSYVPTSLTPGTTFDWTRAAVAGIANAAGTGTGNPMETLDNQTADPITVTYVYTLTANGCTNPTTYSVDVVVNPTPYLNTTLTPAPICNNTLFSYIPGSNTVGTAFNWSRGNITGISNAAATGTGDPNETLENTTTTPIDVVYEYTMTANGCSHTQSVTVTVYPSVTVANAGTDIGPLNATATLLNANQPSVGTGNWSFVTGPNTPVIVDPALFNTEVNTLVPGTYTFVWTVTSPWNCPGSTDTMHVIINVPPVAHDDSASTNVNTGVTIAVTNNDTDADGTIDVTTVTIISYPSHGTVNVSGVTGNVLYTPDNNYIGLDNFTYTVKDNDNAVSNIANVVVSVYERPNAVNDDTMTMTNVPVGINVLANDIEGSGALDPTTVEVVSDVTHGITMVDPTTGIVTYTPENGYYGTDHFTYYMKDVLNSVSDTAHVTIRIYKAPIAVNNADTTLEDIPVLVDIAANDTAFGIGLNLGSVVIVTNPAHGTVVNKNDGTVLYTPNNGYFGNDEFTYTIRDYNGFVSNVAKVNIHVVQNTPDLFLVKTIATPISQIEVGKTVEFNIMLTNIGKEVATEVVVTDILAENLGGKNVRLEVENGTATYDETTKTITWNISNLAVGESFMMKVFVQVTSGGDITNTATAQCRENDVIVSNNSSTAFADMTSKEDLFIPNVITVNGDGKNDNFQVLGLEKYPNAEFMVFNRWGSMIYESKDYKNNWDGLGLNEGTYYYVLKVNKYGVVKEYSGWVQVLR